MKSKSSIVLKFIANNKTVLIIFSILYVIFWCIVFARFGWSGLFPANDPLSAVKLTIYPVFLIAYFWEANRLLNIHYGMMSTGGLFESKESWYHLMAAFPVFGVLPITFRLTQKVNELKKKDLL